MAVKGDRCANCDKPAQKMTNRVDNPHFNDDRARAAWTYSGNHQVVSRDYHWWPPHGTEGAKRQWLACVHTWDGETYYLACEPFCTLRCALVFARSAHRAGYRL